MSSCPIDFCWIEGIYKHQEEELTVIDNGSNGGNDGNDDADVTIAKPMTRKGSFFGSVIHTLSNPSNKQNEDISDGHNFLQVKRHNTSSVIDTTSAVDTSTMSTNSSTSTSYAEIVIPAQGPAPITPSTISSNTRSELQDSRDSTRDSSISTEFSSELLVDKSTSTGFTTYTVPEPIPNPIGVDLSPIGKSSSSSQSSIMQKHFLDLTQEEEDIDRSFIKDEHVHKEVVDKYSGLSKHEVAYIEPFEVVPIHVISVPNSPEDNPSRIYSKKNPLLLSPTKPKSSPSGRPPISPHSKSPHSKQSSSQSTQTAKTDDDCLEAPPQLNRYQASDVSLFENFQSLSLETRNQIPTCTAGSSSSTTESVEVQIISPNQRKESQDNPNSSRSFAVAATAATAATVTSTTTYAIHRNDDVEIAREGLLPSINEISLVSVVSVSVHADEDESLIGHNLVNDDEICTCSCDHSLEDEDNDKTKNCDNFFSLQNIIGK